MQVINEDSKSIRPNVATIGFFDGVHLGHCNLIEQVKSLAVERKLSTLLITFKNHPCEVLQENWKPLLLTSFTEKLARLSDLTSGNVDYCCPLSFTKALSALTAREFMEQYLRDKLNVKVLVIGYDHHFGSDIDEGFEDYQMFGKELGIEVIQARKFSFGTACICSSSIRKFLQEGQVDKAAEMLGRPYAFEGNVVRGEQIGRLLGFPTANINPDHIEKMLPKDGSYAVRVTCSGDTFPGMLYIGTRPTFGEANNRSIEVNILHFTGNIYGQHLRIDFLQFLRGESKFDSPEALKEQLLKDMRQVELIEKQTR